jgi:hypothetical protein
LLRLSQRLVTGWNKKQKSSNIKSKKYHRLEQKQKISTHKIATYVRKNNKTGHFVEWHFVEWHFVKNNLKPLSQEFVV